MKGEWRIGYYNYLTGELRSKECSSESESEWVIEETREVDSSAVIEEHLGDDFAAETGRGIEVSIAAHHSA